MKVLLHGAPFLCAGDPLAHYEGPHEIRSLGIGDGADYVYDPLRDNFVAAFRRIAVDWRPDLVICWFPERYPPPQGIEDSPATILAVAGEWDIHYPELAVNLSRYDVVLTEKAGVEALHSEAVTPGHAGSLYAPDPGVVRLPDTARDIDVLFIGPLNHARHHRRAKLLERLAKLSDQHKVVLAWTPHGDEYTRYLNRARLVFAHSERGELSDSAFDALTAGALCLVEEDNREAADWLADGQEFVLYNEQNLEEIIHYCLANPEESSAIAERGNQRAADFKGERRLDDLIAYAAAQESQGRRFASLPPGDRLYQSALMYRGQQHDAFRQAERLLLDRLVRERPQDPRGWAALGCHHLGHGGEWEQATKAFTRAHQLDPGSGPYAYGRAYAWAQCGNLTQQRAALADVLASDHCGGGSEVPGHYGDRFWVRWRRALAHHAGSLEILKTQAHMALARLDEAHGSYAEAEAHLRAAAALDPENHEGAVLHAEALWREGHKAEAVELLECALSELPFNFDARLHLSDMLAGIGRMNDAERLNLETQRILAALKRNEPR